MKIQYRENGISVFESELYRTTTTIIEWNQLMVMVDPNWLPSEINTIRQYVETHSKGKKLFILFTHADYDHIIGYGAFPEAKTVAGLDFVENPLKDEAIQQIKNFDEKFYISRSYPILYPEIDFVVQQFELPLSFLGEEAVFFEGRGHVQNGMITCFPSKQLCIAGDYLSNVEIPMVEYSFEDYAKTLETFEQIIQQFNISTCVVGHGDIALGKDEILRRILEDKKYIQGFLEGFDPYNPVFKKTILSKDFHIQNRQIHQDNVHFYLKNRPS